jgi:hypothetical protein
VRQVIALRADWFADVRGAGIATVAARLGLAVKRNHISPCPSCGAERRGSADSRGPAGITNDGAGWRCHRCGASGDAVTLAAFPFAGAATPSADGWRLVRAGCADAGLCAANGITPDASRPRRPALTAPAPPNRPPTDEVTALWSACGPVTDDAEVHAWLKGVRGLDATTVEDRKLARALPRAGSWPRWARIGGRTWTDTGHRLVFPLFGATGQMESLRARRVLQADDQLPKSLAPAGAELRGLVLADALARMVLTGAAPGWWPASQPLRVVITEGEPDYLTWATHYGDAAETVPAVFGIVSGSWTPDLAARLPAGARVTVRTHADEAGDKYAVKVVETLRGRCVVLRGGKNGD